jgi:hypothetical protein
MAHAEQVAAREHAMGAFWRLLGDDLDAGWPTGSPNRHDLIGSVGVLKTEL